MNKKNYLPYSKSIHQFVLLILLILTSSSTLAATVAKIEGNVSYEMKYSQVTIEIDKIRNTKKGGMSGTIFIELWATKQNSPTSPGFTLARKSMADFSNTNKGRLKGGQSFTNIQFTESLVEPPPGEYYIHLLTSEYPNTNTIVDSLTFTTKEVFYNTSVSPISGGSFEWFMLLLLGSIVSIRFIFKKA